MFQIITTSSYTIFSIDNNFSQQKLSELNESNKPVNLSYIYYGFHSLNSKIGEDYHVLDVANFSIKASVWMLTKNCFPNNRIINIKSFEFIRSSQNFLLFINFTLIFINYVLIFIFVSKRRNKKIKRKNYFQSILNKSRLDSSIKNLRYDDSENITYKETELATTQTNSSKQSKNKSTQTESVPQKSKHLGQPEMKNETSHLVCEGTNDFEKSTIIQIKYSVNFFANLKTAFMLFVVTIIMAIVYTPALLTSLGFISYNPIHWNIIYINNAANPIVYSFMNIKFRKKLQRQIKSILK